MPAPGSVKGHPHYRTQAPKLRSILSMFPHFCHSPAFFSLRSSRVEYKYGFDTRCAMMDGYEGHYKEYTELQAGNQLLYKLLSGEYSLIHHLTTFPQHYLSGVGSVVRYYPQTLCAMVRVDNDSNYQKNEWICKVGYRRYQGALGEKRMCAARRNGRGCGGVTTLAFRSRRNLASGNARSRESVSVDAWVAACDWAGLQIDLSESRDLVLEAGDLSGGEVVQARVVGVVHVVLDG